MVSAPAQLDDVAPTLLSDMGVTPTGMQGNVLSDALNNPSSAATAARMTEIKQTTPLVNALVSQDRKEGARYPSILRPVAII
jgi:hypothetical protein